MRFLCKPRDGRVLFLTLATVLFFLCLAGLFARSADAQAPPPPDRGPSTDPVAPPRATDPLVPPVPTPPPTPPVASPPLTSQERLRAQSIDQLAEYLAHLRAEEKETVTVLKEKLRAQKQKLQSVGIELDENAMADKINHDWRNQESYDVDDGSVVDW